MQFDRTNTPYRLLFLQNNLWGDYSVGWYPVRTNTLGLRLVPGSVDGITNIDPRPSPEIFAHYGFGLLFTEDVQK